MGKFRNSAGFGKRVEYWIMGKMLMEGLDIYVPLVDDDAIDVVIRRPDQTFTTVQIKARSKCDFALYLADFFANCLAKNCELFGNFVTGGHFSTYTLPNNSQNLAN